MATARYHRATGIPLTKGVECSNEEIAQISAQLAKEGLKDFVKNVIAQFQKQVVHLAEVRACFSGVSLPMRCCSCSTANLLPCPTFEFCSERGKCNEHDLNVPEKKPSRPCPNDFCNFLMENIRLEHNSTPAWKNSDARKWSTDAFQICKCFMPLCGYSHVQSLDETDLFGMLTIIETNKKFKNCLSENSLKYPDIIKKVWFIDGRIGTHSDSDLAMFIHSLICLLSDPKNLATSRKALNAVEKLTQLKIHTKHIKTDVNKSFRMLRRGNGGEKLKSWNYSVEETLSEQDSGLGISALAINSYDNTTPVDRDTNKKRSRIGAPDLTDWEQVISVLADKDAIYDEPLIEKLGFPTQDQLNRLQEIYLKTKSKIASDLLKDVEISICKLVTSKNTRIKYAWLAGVFETNGDIRVKLVIEVDNNSEEIKTQDALYDPFIIQHDVFSEEAKFMMSANENYDEITLNDLRSIQNSINKQANKLMKDHKHLSIINASSTKSKGFNSPGEHRIIQKTCIVLYVRKKGFIPVGEEPFADKLDGYPTDVREGVFYPSMKTEGEDTLKMGCKIVKKHTTDDGREYFNYGTLGGFINHPEYGICGLTCAHVLLDENELKRLRAERELTWLNFHTGDIDVYLNTEPKIKIGRLTKAILTTGDEGSHGMDAAIFQIEKLFPKSGIFVNVLTQEEDPVHFDTGKVFGSSRCSSDLRVFKYGSTTGKTVGKFVNAMPVTNVRFHARPFLADMMNIMDTSVSCNLHNQMEIKSINNTVFSEQGDSGSLLMTEGQNGDRFCMGILEGRTNYRTSIITPIGPILEKMNVSSLNCFEEEQMRETIRSLEETTRQTRLEIKSTNESLHLEIKRTNESLHDLKKEILLAINDLKQSNQHGSQQTDINDSGQATGSASFDNAHNEPRHTDQKSAE